MPSEVQATRHVDGRVWIQRDGRTIYYAPKGWGVKDTHEAAAALGYGSKARRQIQAVADIHHALLSAPVVRHPQYAGPLEARNA